MARVLFSFLLASVLALATVYEISGVQYGCNYQAGSTPGGLLWINQLGNDYSKDRMGYATYFIRSSLGIRNDQDTRDVQRVTLYIQDVVGNGQNAAETLVTGQTAAIRLSGRYLQSVVNEGKNLKEYFFGILIHEMTHVWQWYGDESGRSDNVTEGIADFVRLSAGYPDRDWVQNGRGSNWWLGYDVTAKFLKYCDTYVDQTFVEQLNRKMRYGYNDGFFREISGDSAYTLWREYKSFYGL